jgi:hypothetical protein
MNDSAFPAGEVADAGQVAAAKRVPSTEASWNTALVKSQSRNTTPRRSAFVKSALLTHAQLAAGSRVAGGRDGRRGRRTQDLAEDAAVGREVGQPPRSL